MPQSRDDSDALCISAYNLGLEMFGAQIRYRRAHKARKRENFVDFTDAFLNFSFSLSLSPCEIPKFQTAVAVARVVGVSVASCRRISRNLKL